MGLPASHSLALPDRDSATYQWKFDAWAAGMAEGAGVAAPEGVVDGLPAAVTIGAGCEETDDPGVPAPGAGGRGVAAA